MFVGIQPTPQRAFTEPNSGSIWTAVLAVSCFFDGGGDTQTVSLGGVGNYSITK
jgi:hypothetical protein